LDVMLWGSCRFALRSSKVGFVSINAKAEGIDGRPALREAFQPPRSFVPVDVFYERKKAGTEKQPERVRADKFTKEWPD
jgi:putative SOS response-associated peptidase YedK